MQTISAKNFHTILRGDISDDFLLIDVRTKEEFDAGHIEEAMHYPLDTLLEHKDDISRYATAYIYCASGSRSERGCQLLDGVGIEHTVHLLGGVTQWLADGFGLVNEETR